MYPELYHAHHQLRLEDLSFWQTLADKLGGPILELGCGAGRILLPLAEAGHAVIGLDNDPAILALLESFYQPKLHPNLSIIQADMTDFHLQTRFVLIIFPCNTFSTLGSKSRRATLKAVRGHLAPSGLFVFSIPNPELLANLPTEGEPEIEETFPHPQTGYPVQVISSWQRSDGEPGDGDWGIPHLTFHWRYDHLHPDGTIKRITAFTRHTLDPVDAYLHDLRAAGLRPTARYGDYEFSTYSPLSTYLILLAEPG